MGKCAYLISTIPVHPIIIVVFALIVREIDTKMKAVLVIHDLTFITFRIN